MKKLIYFFAAVTLLISASSCSKECIQCVATDKGGNIINTSQVVCEMDPNRKAFEDRYRTYFQQYTVICGAPSH